MHKTFTAALAVGGLVLAFAGQPSPTFAESPTAGVQHQGLHGGGHRGNGIAKELNLSPQQREQIKQIRTSTRSQIEAIRNDASLTPKQKKDKLKDLRTASLSQIEALLTPEQKQKFEELREQRRAERGGRGGGVRG